MKKFNILSILIAIFFSSFSQAPTITSFSPVSGQAGTLVTIRGTNLSSPTGLAIGGISAILVSGGSDSIVGMVMPGASTGSVSVTTAGGSTTGSGNFTVGPTPYPATQQATLGGAFSVAISADGNTAILGEYVDSNETGAAWVYTRSGSTWTQQGGKLVGTGATGAAGQGFSVALSADGNTALLGAPYDHSNGGGQGGIGALWVFTRNGGIWTQQGTKLVGTGATGGTYGIVMQGRSVALSADGNTAITGGSYDNSDTGAVWIFTRTSGTWTQQGAKLVGAGAVVDGNGNIYQGWAVALSADGNTAMVGGPNDNLGIGATWVYTRTSGTWTQQGAKIVGTGYIDTTWAAIVYQGSSVALSADGNTAIVGGYGDNADAGAAWIYTRSGNTWTQQGAKLVGAGAVFDAEQGTSVSLSADGNTAIVGGDADNAGVGATWVYTRTGGAWAQQGAKLIGTGAGSPGGGANQGRSVALSADASTALVGSGANGGGSWVFSICTTDSSIAYDTISSGLPYTWNGLTFTGPGTQTAHLTGSNGCDSSATLVLTVSHAGISEISSPFSIHLYPDPSRGSFTLETSNSIGSDYTISDMLGHVIMRQSIKADNETIELPDVAEGVYTLAVKTSQPVRFVIVR